jgi:formiminoglutamase
MCQTIASSSITSGLAMSAPSSSEAGWSSRLEPLRPHENVLFRPDDPRLGDRIVSWHGDLSAPVRGRAVLVGFPQDEGVRRNMGRTGAAQAPAEIRRWLGKLTPFDPISETSLTQLPPLDAGNVRISGTLEETQQALGEVVGGIMQTDAVPIVLGGGHETTYGVYLGYVLAQKPAAIINIDAHLDVRPCPEGRGNSGTPFRQALEHASMPLPGDRYACLGLQRHAVARQHLEYARQHGCVIRWREECAGQLEQRFTEELARLAKAKCRVHVTVDADAVDARSVPGVSAPNVLGLDAAEVIACALRAGESPAVASVDVVEINPAFDRDGQSARWAALLVWTFLVGLANRSG